jgi:hypothetical protein
MFSKRKKKRTQVEDDTSFRKGIVTLDGKALPKKKISKVSALYINYIESPSRALFGEYYII